MKKYEFINLTKYDTIIVQTKIRESVEKNDHAAQCYWQGWAQAKEDTLGLVEEETYATAELVIQLKIDAINAEALRKIAKLKDDVAQETIQGGYESAKLQDVGRLNRTED